MTRKRITAESDVNVVNCSGATFNAGVAPNCHTVKVRSCPPPVTLIVHDRSSGAWLEDTFTNNLFTPGNMLRVTPHQSASSTKSAPHSPDTST